MLWEGVLHREQTGLQTEVEVRKVEDAVGMKVVYST